ncbi:MAG: hypothetical protein M3022_01630 [Actinomycetota bacterium]|nr:hypothetical protein [Actinomycetota bacterium]
MSESDRARCGSIRTSSPPQRRRRSPLVAASLAMVDSVVIGGVALAARGHVQAR